MPSALGKERTGSGKEPLTSRLSPMLPIIRSNFLKVLQLSQTAPPFRDLVFKHMVDIFIESTALPKWGPTLSVFL